MSKKGQPDGLPFLRHSSSGIPMFRLAGGWVERGTGG